MKNKHKLFILGLLLSLCLCGCGKTTWPSGLLCRELFVWHPDQFPNLCSQVFWQN